MRSFSERKSTQKTKDIFPVGTFYRLDRSACAAKPLLNSEQTLSLLNPVCSKQFYDDKL